MRVFLLALMVGVVVGDEFKFKHHDNNELAHVLEQVHAKCPNITHVYTLSEMSVRGVPLYVIEFGSRPGHHQPCEFYYTIVL